jgi:YfiH family protein
VERRNRGSVVWYGFPELERQAGVVAAVGARHGGTSSGGFTSLNQSYSVGDDAESVAENQRRFAEAISLANRCTVTTSQVHQTDVACADDVLAESPGACAIGNADALIARRNDVSLAMNFADCVPILVADPRSDAIGLAHAGWRGTFGGVAGEIVRALRDRYGSRPAHLLVAIGPSIGPCCYEVGTELVERARQLWPWSDKVAIRSARGWNLDLWEANVRQLVDLGVPRENIELTAVCTSCNNHDFFSHRAQRGHAGRFRVLITRRSGEDDV